jgi:hypothetical protein
VIFGAAGRPGIQSRAAQSRIVLANSTVGRRSLRRGRLLPKRSTGKQQRSRDQNYLPPARATLDSRFGQASILPPNSIGAKEIWISVPAKLDPEGYVLVVTMDDVLVAGQTPAGTFYGLANAKQLVEGKVPRLLSLQWKSSIGRRCAGAASR